MSRGYLALVLHAHLPYVRHPEYNDFLEEDWLYEAITETYLPLLNVFEGLLRDGVKFRVTMSMSPTLLGMLADPLLQERYVQHMQRLLELAEKEIHRTRHEADFQALARMYHDHFADCLRTFEDRWGRNLVRAFRALQDSGALEIMTCGVTHGFLPLMETRPEAVRAQIQLAAADYERHFGRGPRGIWLPECGYYPGVEDFIKEAGIRFFVIDAHGVLFATPRPKHAIYAPLYCPNGVAAFGRDIESSKQVWSANEGYPGDYNYREFYRDVGFDLDQEYIGPYIHSDGIRINTGIKYYAITGPTPHKRPYRRDVALDTAASHAGNFMFNRERQVEHLADLMGQPPIVVSPYDAELFGHWWFEGPQFIDFLFRKMYWDQNVLEPITPYEHLQRQPRNQVARPSYSSWGYKGYAEYWLDGTNDWIYRHLDHAANQMVELATRHHDVGGLAARALNQAARELVLAQASDWAFAMKTGTTVPYAVRRTKEHLQRFGDLARMVQEERYDETQIADVEQRDNLLPAIDFRVYARS